jgi:hypothetical protein
VHRISDLWCWWVLVAAGRCQVHVVHINDDSSFRIETKAGRPTPLKHCLKLIHAVLDLVIGVLVSGDVAGLPCPRTELMRDIEKQKYVSRTTEKKGAHPWATPERDIDSPDDRLSQSLTLVG